MFDWFFYWLQKVRIKVKASKKQPLQPKVDSLNPFDAIIENRKHPFARIIRESFLVGIADTYEVLVGNHYDIYLTGKGRKGVLDILIVPLIGRWLMGIAFNPRYGTPVRVLAGIPAFILEILRGLLGSFLTLCFSPVVAVVHLVLAIPAYLLRRKAEELEIEMIDRQEQDIEQTQNTTTKLSSLLEREELELCDIRYVKLEPSEAQPNDTQAVYELSCQYLFGRTSGRHFKPKVNSEHDESFQAFQELNIGGRRFDKHKTV
jgi:hypothetical protein